MDRVRAANNALMTDASDDSDIDMIHHQTPEIQEQHVGMDPSPDMHGSPGVMIPLSNDELAERIHDLQSASSSREILVFLNSLRIDNSKTGISLSWNRALKVLKAHNLIAAEYKPYSQLRSGEKLEITARLNAVQDDIIINDLKTAILDGFIQDSRYPRKRKMKWSQLLSAEDPSASIMAAAEHDPSIASHFAMMVNQAEQEEEGVDAITKKLKAKGVTGPNAAKEAELLIEKIKNVRVERLQKAINDQVTWNLLTQEVRDGVLAEYAKLLKS